VASAADFRRSGRRQKLARRRYVCFGVILGRWISVVFLRSTLATVNRSAVRGLTDALQDFATLGPHMKHILLLTCLSSLCSAATASAQPRTAVGLRAGDVKPGSITSRTLSYPLSRLDLPLSCTVRTCASPFHRTVPPLGREQRSARVLM